MRSTTISVGSVVLGIFALVLAANSILIILALHRPSETPADEALWVRFSRRRWTISMSLVAFVFLFLALQGFGIDITPGSVSWILISVLGIVVGLFGAELVAGAVTYIRRRRARAHRQRTSSDDVA